MPDQSMNVRDSDELTWRRTSSDWLNNDHGMDWRLLSSDRRQQMMSHSTEEDELKFL